jgi:hypothetical protein
MITPTIDTAADAFMADLASPEPLVSAWARYRLRELTAYARDGDRGNEFHCGDGPGNVFPGA